MEDKHYTSSKKYKLLVDDLSNKNVWSYGVGHFMNDICASSWFFFLSYYLIQIIGLDENKASYIILAGQLADGFATPIVGILSDKFDTKIGKRTPWYLGGTILVSISFIFIFFSFLPENTCNSYKFIYYAIFGSLFNIGWAAVQVSHMALLPSITLNVNKKDEMTKIRTGFTFLAQTLTLSLSFIFFTSITDKILQYKALAGVSIIIGLISSSIFLIFCNECKLTKNIHSYLEKISKKKNEENINCKITNIYSLEGIENISSCNSIGESKEKIKKKINEINWIYWLNQTDFYFNIIVYMFVRLSINITSIVLPFYMEFVLKFQKTSEGGTPYEITICLLVSTLGSIFNSVYLQDYFEKNTNTESLRISLILKSIKIF